MKFVLALIVWLGFGIVVATGVVMTVKGHSAWLLLLSLAVFLLMFVRFGCRAH